MADRTITPIRVNHEMLLQVFYSVDGETVAGRPIDGPGELRMMNVKMPVIIPSVRLLHCSRGKSCADATVLLHDAIAHSADVQPIRHAVAVRDRRDHFLAAKQAAVYVRQHVCRTWRGGHAPHAAR